MRWTGAALRTARARRGWTQQELAEHLGASLRSVASWERGEATPQAHWAAKLDDLLGGDAPREVGLSEASFPELLAEIHARYARLESEVGHTPAPARERFRWYSADAPTQRNPDTPEQGKEQPKPG